jgi:hypothetical protein
MKREEVVSYFDAAGHRLVYLLVVVGILYIAGLTVLTLRKALARAAKIGYAKNRMNKVIGIAVSHSLVPAVAVLIGFFTLAPLLGIPLSWWRLSIIGNTAYEIMAADLAVKVAGAPGVSGATINEFVLIIYIMAIGIMGSLLLASVLSKRILQGTLRTNTRDRRWSALSGNFYVTTIIVVFAVPLLLSSRAALFTFAAGVAATGGLNLISRKCKCGWLSDFSFALGMLAAMSSSVFWTHFAN